jgi:uncharacterized YccA/Bax inhibitor family protein
MANPALNSTTWAPERAYTQDDLAAGYAAPGGAAAPGAAPPAPPTGPGRTAVGGRGRADASTGVMTIDGTIARTMILLAILVGAGTFGWMSVDHTATTAQFPGWLFIAAIAALGVAIVTIRKPQLAMWSAPAYAVLEGLVVGAISGVYDAVYKGIVLEAVLLTLGVFALMLVLFLSGTIRNTPKFQKAMMLALGSILVVYLGSFIFSIFGSTPTFISADSSLLGIGFSIVVVIVAALTFIIDFDQIRVGVAAGAPKYMEWYGGFGLLITLVWLYLEILRLLARLRN